VGVLVSLPGKIIKIKEIRCRDQYGNCNETLTEKLDVLQGTGLTYTKDKVKEIMTNDKAVEKYTQRFLLPGIIDISLISRKPFCLVAENSSEEKFVLIDSAGVDFGYSSTVSVPPITVNGTYSGLEESEKNKILFGCRILKGIYNQAQIKKALYNQNQLIIDFDGDIKVIFPVEGDAKKLSGSINLILSRFINGKEGDDSTNLDLKGKTIDMRFANPVISKI
jgi:hypothetical protein